MQIVFIYFSLFMRKKLEKAREQKCKIEREEEKTLTYCIFFKIFMFIYEKKQIKKHQNNPADSTPKLKFLGETLIFPIVDICARTYRRPR
jgi:hypothetical protein